MTERRQTTTPRVAVTVGLVLLTALAVLAVPTFPLAAPVVALAAATACFLVRRRTGQTLIFVLLWVNVAALLAAGVIDLFLLTAGGEMGPPPQ